MALRAMVHSSLHLSRVTKFTDNFPIKLQNDGAFIPLSASIQVISHEHKANTRSKEAPIFKTSPLDKPIIIGNNYADPKKSSAFFSR